MVVLHYGGTGLVDPQYKVTYLTVLQCGGTVFVVLQYGGILLVVLQNDGTHV